MDDPEHPSAPEITIYSYKNSPYALKLGVCLHYKNLEFRSTAVDILTQREIAFTHQKLIPVLEIDAEWRIDSTPLAIWLEERFPDPPLLGRTPASRERILEIDHWVSHVLIPMVFREFVEWEHLVPWLMERWRYARVLYRTKPFPRILLAIYPLILMGLGRFGFMKKIVRELPPGESMRAMHERVLSEFREHLGEGPFLGGLPEASLADLAAWPQIVAVWVTGAQKNNFFLQHPDIKDWAIRVAHVLPRHPFLFDEESVEKQRADQLELGIQ